MRISYWDYCYASFEPKLIYLYRSDINFVRQYVCFAVTGHTRLIRTHSFARFSFELGGIRIRSAF